MDSVSLVFSLVFSRSSLLSFWLCCYLIGNKKNISSCSHESIRQLANGKQIYILLDKLDLAETIASGSAKINDRLGCEQCYAKN